MRPFLALCFACLVLLAPLTSRNVFARDFTDWENLDWAKRVVSGVFLNGNKDKVAIFVNSQWEDDRVGMGWREDLAHYTVCNSIRQLPKGGVEYFVVLYDMGRHESLAQSKSLSGWMTEEVCVKYYNSSRPPM